MNEQRFEELWTELGQVDELAGQARKAISLPAWQVSGRDFEGRVTLYEGGVIHMFHTGSVTGADAKLLAKVVGAAINTVDFAHGVLIYDGLGVTWADREARAIARTSLGRWQNRCRSTILLGSPLLRLLFAMESAFEGEGSRFVLGSSLDHAFEILGGESQPLDAASRNLSRLPHDLAGMSAANDRLNGRITQLETERDLFFSDLANVLSGATAPGSIGWRGSGDGGDWSVALGIIQRDLREATLGLEQREEALKEAQERLETVQRIAHIGSWEWDIRADHISWSLETLAIVGLDPDEDELTFAGYLAMLPEEDRRQLEQAVGNSMATGASYELDHRLILPNGETRTVACTGQVERDATARPVSMSGTIYDITNRRRIEDERSARAAAEESNRAKTEFLAMMSHDLRTPLNGVVSSLDLLRGVAGPDAAPLVADLDRSSRDLERLIDDLLGFARLEIGQLTLVEEPADLHQLIYDVVRQQQRFADERGVDLSASLDGTLPRWVRLDRAHLTHLLSNLVRQALARCDSGQVEILAAWRSGTAASLEVSVSDTGCGLPSVLIEELRQDSASPLGDATHLGLAICARLARLMRGELQIARNGPDGTEFRLRAGLVVAQRPGNSAVGDSEFSDYAGKCCLVVDDDVVNRRLVSHMLRKMGFAVTEACDGSEAVSQFEAGTFELVLMDCEMPIMDGFDATRAIRSSEAPNEHVPILAFTAHALSSNQERCMEVGMDDMVIKPLRVDGLRRAVDSVLG